MSLHSIHHSNVEKQGLRYELTGALDTRTGQEVLKLFQKLNDMGHTIVMITHDMQVAAHAHSVVPIVDGALTG